MNVTRVAAWSCGGALLAVWLAAAAGAGRQPAPAVRQRPAESTRPSTDLRPPSYAAQARRLREYSRVAPTPQHPSRNPFAFARSSPSPAVTTSAGRPTDAPSTDGSPPASDPVFGLALIGVASSRTELGLERTAVISGPGGVLLVKGGDLVRAQVRVAFVEEGAVVLENLETGVTTRLQLP